MVRGQCQHIRSSNIYITADKLRWVNGIEMKHVYIYRIRINMALNRNINQVNIQYLVICFLASE